MINVQERIQRYFRSKARQLIAAADQSVCEHPSLIGSHREEIYRIYLRDVLPKRFDVGRGMVYGQFHRSREADIVIWDSQNYPSLPMQDHSLFFAESVKAVLESKSLWNDEAFKDVLEKCRAVRDIVTISRPNLADDIAMLQQEIVSLRSQREHHGMLIHRHHIGTAAIFLRGGQSLTPTWINKDTMPDIDDAWPDVLMLLEPGRVIIKNYESSESMPLGGRGCLEFYDIGEDALLGFSTALLALITERSVQVEDPLFLTQYAPMLSSIEPRYVDFQLTRPVPQRVPIWRSE